MTTEIRYSFGNRENPRPLLAPADWDPVRPRWRQVHGVSAARVEGPAQECGEVDALWTTQVGIPIAVVTADCVPLLLERDGHSAIAAIHAGWRGTRAKIIEQFFRTLPREFSDPSRWSARIGPCIRACCYEVSADLIRNFAEGFPEMDPKDLEPSPSRLDLVAVNRAELRRLGVGIAEEHPHCTFCARNESDFRYFSYRRGDRDSRQFSVISIHSDL